MDRRAFLGVASMSVAGSSCLAATALPIIDTHIHLFDPGRPQGVPWPPKDDAVLYHAALPDRYRGIAKGHGVVGAIEVECSPWLEDNQWVLDVAAKNPIMVGMVGNLEPGHADFRKHLERFHRNPLFLGIRYGNLWGRDLGTELAKPEFVAGLKALAEAGLTLDSANPNPALIAALLRVSDLVPGLRIVVDHLPQMSASYQGDVHTLAQRPQVYVKLSEVLRRVDGHVPTDLSFYRAHLDELWGMFGADRVLFGSDWPNSDKWAQYPEVLNLVRGYVSSKGEAAIHKYFWKNSQAAYRWKPRDASQPGSA